MTTEDALERGRRAFEGQAWGEAFTELAAADAGAPLGLDDLEALAAAAYLTGRMDAAAEVWGRAHHGSLRAGEAARAARCAFWLGFSLLYRGEMALGGG